MDDLVRQVIASSVPTNESLKSSDFFGAVATLQKKIVDLFRYSSLNYLPPFLNGMLSEILKNSNSRDKRTRFATAISVTALMHLFPFDDYVPQYKPIIEKLLVPGYRPIIDIGAIVVSRLARISGINRDAYLRELIDRSRRMLVDKNIEAQYTAAAVWCQLAKAAPEGFFNSRTKFVGEVVVAFRQSDRVVTKRLIETLNELFDCEAGSVGARFLNEMHFEIVQNIEMLCVGNRKPDEVLSSLQLLYVLLSHPPYINHRVCDEVILPMCVEAMKSSNYTTIEFSLLCLFKLLKINAIKATKELARYLMGHILEWVSKFPREMCKLMMKFIRKFGVILSAEDNMSQLKEMIDHLTSHLSSDIGPILALRATAAAIESLDIQYVSGFLTKLSEIMKKSMVPMPVQEVVKALNIHVPNWHNVFPFFYDMLLHGIRHELGARSNRTDRIVIALKTVHRIPAFSDADAFELSALVMKCAGSKDVEVRELITKVCLHLFEMLPKRIPIHVIFDLVKITLEDPVRSVRIRSLKSFTPIVFPYITQPDIFREFSKFFLDESWEVRKYSLNIVQNLFDLDYAYMRNLLLNSLKLINTNFEVVVPETTPSWVVFPHVIEASGPILSLYADSVSQIFREMLERRFLKSVLKETTLIYMNSAVLKEIDESLIKTVTRLYVLCPEIVPVKPILDAFAVILSQPVHPWTKENVLKSLKNLSNVVSVDDITPTIVPALISIIRKNESTKLVTKTMKVLGTIGVLEDLMPPRPSVLFFKSYLSRMNHLKQYFLNIYFEYLSRQFISVNIDSYREAIAKVVSVIFCMEPSIIPEYIDKFLPKYLEFIRNSSSDKLTPFLEYLEKIITYAGHTIIPYSERIMQSIEHHWHEQYTKAASMVLASLVKTTRGQCDATLRQVVSVCFLLMRAKTDIENSASELFELLKAVAEFSPAYLSSIIDGLVMILSTPGSPAFLQRQSLDTIEYIVTSCNPSQHLAMIIRCLNAVAGRSQMIWRERATKILAIIETSQFRVQKPRFRKPGEVHRPNLEQRRIDFGAFEEKLKPPVRDDKGQANVIKWFNDLREYVLTSTPCDVMATCLFLPVIPKFAFKFAFLSIWNSLDENEQDRVSDAINCLFSRLEIPNLVLTQFVGLVELFVMSEIKCKINLSAVVGKCIPERMYGKALFFLENGFNGDESPEIIDNLARMNMAVRRHEEARAIAFANKESIRCPVWMALGEYETALELMKEKTDDNLVLRMKCLAALENWEQIKNMKEEFMEQGVLVQAQLARFMWTSELYQGSHEEALKYIHMTGGYTVNDCIQKAIVYIAMGMYHKANDTVHLAWRYLSASVSALGKHNNTSLSDHIFQAVQLHELAEVIDIKLDPKMASEHFPAWSVRLRYLNNDPMKQKELFKIRSLVPDVVDRKEFAYSILSSIKRSQKESARLIDLFFPDKDSIDAKYCHAQLLPSRHERIEAAKLLVQNSSDDVNPRLNKFIGKELFYAARSIADLDECLKYASHGRKQRIFIAKVLAIKACVAESEDDAKLAVEALGKAISQGHQAALLLHVLQTLLVTFPHSKSISKAASKVFAEIDLGTLQSVSNSAVELLCHSCQNVASAAAVICSKLTTEIPQSIIFNLLCKQNNRYCRDLLNELQKTNSVVYSQITLVVNKLIRMTNTIYDRWVNQLTLAVKYIGKKKYARVTEIVRDLQRSLKEPSFSRYETEFLAKFQDDMKQLLTNLNQQVEFDEEDTKAIQNLATAMIKRQDSIRIIPLSSVDEQLDKKTNWHIPIIGKDVRSDLQVNKFFHSIERLDDGIKFAVIGSNGRKYSFHLSSATQDNVQQSEQFACLIEAMTPVPFTKPLTVLLPGGVKLSELLKGRITLSDLIALYAKSKGSDYSLGNIDYEAYDSYDEARKLQKLQRTMNHVDPDLLRKALMVTSRNTTSWLHKSSQFARSMGVLAGLSYIMGSVSTSPVDILIDRTTGEATCSRVLASREAQPVPFRLTPMIEHAFGRSGVVGPFKISLCRFLTALQKHSQLLGLVLQFAVCQGPYEPAVFPDAILEKYGKEILTKGELSDVDCMFSRLPSNDASITDTADALIAEARDIEKMAQMPASWIAWW